MALNSQDHESLLENLMVNNTDVIYFKDLDSRFIKVNDACVRKHHFKRADEFIGKTDFDLYSKEHAEQAYADEKYIIKTGETLRSIEERETWADGHVTWGSTTKMPLRDTDGNIIGTFGVTRDITDHKIAELSAKRYADEMRQITEELENDVRMAGELQKNFMPKGYPVFPQGVEASESCIEFLHRETLCGEVSGDFCAITPLSDSQVAVMIYDVKGVGIRSALTIALIRGVMQEVADLIYSPGAYLGRMNELLYPVLGQIAGLDAAACMMVMDIKSGILRFASAGHPMPIKFQPGEGASWLCDDPDAYGPAMGRMKSASYATSKFGLEPGDAILMFTDGLFNVPNNIDHVYGLKRLLDSAQSLVGDPLDEIFDGMEGDALAFSKNGKFIDDVCMVGFHLKALIL